MLFGLLTAITWGVAHYATAIIARARGTYLALFAVRLIALALIVGYGWYARPAINLSLASLALGIGVSLISVAGSVLTYRAYTIGSLALVAPMTSGYALVTLLLAVLLSGEPAAPLAMGGALLMVAGTAVASIVPRRPDAGATLRGVPEALGAMMLVGLFFWLMDGLAPMIGSYTAVLILVCVEVVGFGLLAVRNHLRLHELLNMPWALVGMVGVLSLVGFVSLYVGMQQSHAGLVAALASLSSAVMVVLAGLLLRERLAAWQWGGIGMLLMGVVLVSGS